MSEKESEKERYKKQTKKILLKIIARRRELGMAQPDLAMKLNLGFSGYHKVETGKTKLDTFRLFKILDILEISAKDFFKDFDKK
jgi:transcriptional regulator with XRE-family HTH domain